MATVLTIMADEEVKIDAENQHENVQTEEKDTNDDATEVEQSASTELPVDNKQEDEHTQENVNENLAQVNDDGTDQENSNNVDDVSAVIENEENNKLQNIEEKAESAIDLEESNTEDQEVHDKDLENIGSEAKQMPFNDAIPEEEEPSPEIQISHSVSHEPPYESQEDTFNDKEIPDAYSTPPPPENQEDDQENEDFHDLYEKMKEHSDDGSTPEYTIYDRSYLLDRYKEALEERSQLQNMNNQLQHKLAEYFKKKKTDERVQEVEKNVTDQEQRYLKYISNLEELQNEEKRQQEEIKSQIEDLKIKCQDKQEKVNMASDEYMKFKYDVAKSSVNSRSGKQIPVKDLDQFQIYESKKEQEVVQVRLENIKLKNRLRKKEQQLKAKEELAEGLHLIDFEQLKIENQTYNEKIEERNEEILKLRKKITTTVQVLTHLKEKLQFVQGENNEQRTALKQIDATVAQKRDILTRTKQVRDALRIDNVKLKQKCGLLGNESLLRDFEYRKDEGDELGKKLETLRTDHVGLSMNLNGLKKKIRQTRNHSA